MFTNIKVYATLLLVSGVLVSWDVIDAILQVRQCDDELSFLFMHA